MEAMTPRVAACFPGHRIPRRSVPFIFSLGISAGERAEGKSVFGNEERIYPQFIGGTSILRFNYPHRRNHYGVSAIGLYSK